LLFARRLGAGARLPRWRHTLRSFPLRGRSQRVTALRFPHVVVPAFRSWVRSCCHVWARVLPAFARPQGIAPLRSPLRLAGVATAKLPDAPLGLVPGWFSMRFPNRRSEERRVVGPLVTRRSRRGRPWLVPPRPEGRAGADRGWSRDGPWSAWGPSAVVPLWSEDRAGAVRSLCGPKTARGPAVDGPFVVRRPGAVRGSRARRRPARGQGGRRPVADLTRCRRPEGLWFRLRPSADWPRGTGHCSRLAGRPKAVALLAPRVVRTRRPRRVLVGRAAGHPRASGRRARVRPRGDAPLPSSPAAGVP
jgi:hypothetical protein